MKCLLLSLLAVIMIPLNTTAQQSNEDRCANVGFDSPKSEIVRCLDLQRQERKDAEAKLAAANKAITEAQNAAEAAKKLRSANRNQQNEGVVEVLQGVNSHGNANAVSKEVTDKGLSVMEQVSRQEDAIMAKIESTAKSATKSPTDSSSSGYSTAQQHVLDESGKAPAVAPHLTVEQAMRAQEDAIMAKIETPAKSTASPQTNSSSSGNSAAQRRSFGVSESPGVASHLTVEQAMRAQEEKVLASPSAVKSFAAQVDEATKIAIRDQDARATKQAAIERAAREEKAELARAIADASRLAAKKLSEEAAAEQAEEDKEDAIAARKEARDRAAARAAWLAQFAPPSSLPAYYGAYGESIAPLSTPWLSVPSMSFQTTLEGNSVYTAPAQSGSTHDTFNYFSCMANLSTESDCIHSHEQAAAISDSATKPHQPSILQSGAAKPQDVTTQPAKPPTAPPAESSTTTSAAQTAQ